MDVVNTATDNQALEPLLDFLGGDVQTKVFLLCNGLLYDIEATLFVPCHVASDRSLHVPG